MRSAAASRKRLVRKVLINAVTVHVGTTTDFPKTYRFPSLLFDRTVSTTNEQAKRAPTMAMVFTRGGSPLVNQSPAIRLMGIGTKNKFPPSEMHSHRGTLPRDVTPYDGMSLKS